MKRIVLSLFLLLSCALQAADQAAILAPLISPAKIDTLTASRAANPRLKKICYWLEAARREGKDPAAVIDAAQKADGCAGTARGNAEKAALLRNLTILERLGCLTDAGMEKLRRGNSPEITKGPYAGDVASVDHIIPRAVVPGTGLQALQPGVHAREVEPVERCRNRPTAAGTGEGMAHRRAAFVRRTNCGAIRPSLAHSAKNLG